MSDQQPPPPPPQPGPPAAPPQDLNYATFRSRAAWFYWLAGLSVVNSVLLHMGAGIQFIFGLGFTSLVDGIVFSGGPPTGGARLIGLGLDAMIAAVFAGFGFAVTW